MHLLHLLFASLATALSIDRPVRGQAGGIVPRALPACPKCPGDSEGPYYGAAAERCYAIDPAMLADGQASFQQTFPEGYWPPICDAFGVNCVTSIPPVKWTEIGGLTPPIGRYKRADGSEIIVWCYWQSTLQWVGPGGSGTTYNAHCTVYTCAKGKMRADISSGGSVIGIGVGTNDDPDTCQCFDNNNADITFSLHS